MCSWQKCKKRRERDREVALKAAIENNGSHTTDIQNYTGMLFPSSLKNKTLFSWYPIYMKEGQTGECFLNHICMEMHSTDQTLNKAAWDRRQHYSSGSTLLLSFLNNVFINYF